MLPIVFTSILWLLIDYKVVLRLVISSEVFRYIESSFQHFSLLLVETNDKSLKCDLPFIMWKMVETAQFFPSNILEKVFDQKLSTHCEIEMHVNMVVKNRNFAFIQLHSYSKSSTRKSLYSTADSWHCIWIAMNFVILFERIKIVWQMKKNKIFHNPESKLFDFWKLHLEILVFMHEEVEFFQNKIEIKKWEKRKWRP